MQSKNIKLKVRRWLGFIFLCSLMFCLWLGTLELRVSAQSPDTNQLVNRGLELYQSGDIKAAIASWEKALNIYQQNQDTAASLIVRENLARVYREVGQSTQAIAQWQQVITYYRQEGNLQQVGRSLTELAQVYSSLGQPTKAIALLCNPDKNNHCSSDSAVQIAQTHKDLLGEAAAWGSLGDANRLTGNYQLAITHLQKSLAIANKLNIPALRGSVFYSLGNAHISQALVKYRQADSATQRGDEPQKLLDEGKQADTKALEYLQASLKLASSQNDVVGEMRSHLRIIPLYYRNQETTKATNSLQQAISLLERLPQNRGSVYAAINLVHLLQPITTETTSRLSCLEPETSVKATVLLNQAATIAEKISDFRAESFALGELGHIYECRQEYAKALEITNKARLAAEQGLKAQDSLYLWEWQTGRIFKAQGKIDAAISAYERATNTLDTIRRDILTANRDIQFDFRDTIEPIYRDLVALRLSLAEPRETANKSLVSQDSKNNLSSILTTMDSLKLAELQNYFGDDCIIAPFAQTSIQAKGDPKTAFLNTIILEDKIAVILTLPGGENKSSSIAINRQDFINTINDFRRSLETYYNDIGGYDTRLAKQMYDWLIQPFTTELQKFNIKTLVFIQDGILRSVPMAALYDGEQFLIQKYAVATIPSLNLIDSNLANRRNLRMLALGLTVNATINRKIYQPLSEVQTEIDGVLATIPGKKLLDDNFTSDRLNKELEQQAYPIIHIATHGEFGTEPEDTFIITGKKDTTTGNNQTLSFNQLEQQIRKITHSNQSLELLTLTACQTAVGDERSALGLAGVAVQAGAKSTLASLWAIQDNSTAQIAISFYNKLLNNPTMSKAEALQSAQIEMITGKTTTGQLAHPAYWSPLILIGNWL
ncbi:CHAT domain-containing protein [Nostoc sp. TCL26-01]|uniref:CHAT domain-containing protein n=1 Tax=Nostoc sp. TCL26-01 TaxID=2576904 RepID=UPI0015BE7A3B|nr:CHAT domain-containing protein [Nostoc sp. TCL26-01]QLE55090.1 CHAT domain-containing protein [Nostoc sp. TCL26-01]